MSLETKSFDGDRFNKQQSYQDLLLQIAELSNENHKLREILKRWITLRCWEGFPLTEGDQDVVSLTRRVLK